jgi:RHS repeat-associated protein
MARIRLLAYTILDGTLIPIDRAGADLQLAAAGRRPEPGVARLAVDRVEGRPVLEVVVRGVFEPQHGRAEHLHPQMPGPDRLSFDIGRLGAASALPGVVTSPRSTAASTESLRIVTSYTPVGTPAWHYDDNPLTPADKRTWNNFRGFAGMTVTKGNAPDPVTKTTYTYLRGMDGDHLTSSTTRSVTIADSRGDTPVRDADQFADMIYETRVFNGSDPTPVTDTIADPWSSAATASQDALGFKAYHVDTDKTLVYTPLASGTTRTTEVDKTHDQYGRVTAINDRGDTSTSADDVCIMSKYADNTTAWILDAAYETQTVKVACDSTTPPVIPGDMVSQQHTYYDGSTTLGAAPTTGDVTKAQVLVSYTGSTPNYRTTSTVVDQYGRPTSQTDAGNHVTTTAYTPATGAQPTSMTVTNALKYATTTAYDPLRGLTTSITTPAGYVTSARYDALGRTTDVFNPGRSASSTPSVHYAYQVSNTDPTVVTACALKAKADGCVLSETLYDSMLRARETQAQTAGGTGRTQTDTFYNTDGLVSATTAEYYNGNAVDSVIEPAQDGTIPSETATLYDGAGRKTADIAYSLGTETWRTTYNYGGNFTTTVPPAGGTASTAVVDARGQTVGLRRYHAGVSADYLHAAAGTYDDISYGYDSANDLISEKDSAGNNWSWTYDLVGEQTDAKDPDAGETATTYDALGNAATVTDAEKRQTTTTYDVVGRQTGLYDTTSTTTLSASNKLAAWTYDTVRKGLPASAVSYSGGDTWTDAITLYSTYGSVVTEKYTLAGTDAALLPSAGYTYSHGYNLNGSPSSQTDPAIADLPTENLAYGYDDLGRPTKLTSTGDVTDTYITATGYTNIGQPAQYTLSSDGSSGAENMSYDQQTGALTGVYVTGFGKAGRIDDVTYAYGGAGVSKGTGLLTQITDKQNSGATTDTQCFTYDYSQRIQQAWTATDGCAATPSAGNSANVGAPSAPYWQSWTYDVAGDRRMQIDHDASGITANDTTTTYNYPASGAGAVQPHTLTNTTATGPASIAKTGTFTYNKAGETTGITGGAHGNGTLTWTATGKLATETTAHGSTTNVYDAGGSLIIQRDPATTTLYLADEQIVQDNATKVLTGTRYYAINGTRIAARSGGTAATYEFADRQDTGDLAVNTGTEALTRRQYMPFGDVRGSAVQWVGNSGYVGGADDPNTGLETLGVRQYDTATGRFLSSDPEFESSDPTQLGGYDYAGNDPVSSSDPSGLLGSASCAAGQVGAIGHAGGGGYEGACTGYENSDPAVTPPPRGGNGGWSSQKTVLRGGTTYVSSSKGQSINGVVISLPNDSTTVWDIAQELDKYNIETGYKGPSDLQSTPMGIAAAYYGKYIKFNTDDQVKTGQESLYLLGIAGMFADDNMFSVDPEGLGIESPSIPVRVPTGALGHGDEPEIPTGDIPKVGGNNPGCPNSFDPLTRVEMADGTTKAIALIKVGDKVVATDPSTGRTIDEPVTQLHDNVDTDLADLTVTEGHGRTTTIHTTQSHAFWDVTTGTWTLADHLKAGDRLRSIDDADLMVVSVRAFAHQQHMFNLTVSDLHAYYVLAGESPILVHNDGGSNTTRTGVVRTNTQDWKDQMRIWDNDPIYKDILSKGNRWRIQHDLVPRVDKQWVGFFPGDAHLVGENITMHHINGEKITVPLPTSRHLDAHMPGGYRYNPGGPGMCG